MANINKIKLSGTTYSIQDENATKTVELTQAQYDALAVKDPNTFYIITDATGGDLSNYYTKSETSGATEISTALNAKQDTLVSGTNIKTINNESILGSGNITIEGGGGSSYTAGDGIDITNDVISVTGKVDTTAFTAHTADTVIHVTSAEKTAWNAKSDFSGDYNDLTNKPTIPTVPTSNTAFTNDARYITSDAISGKADTSAVTESINAAVSGKVDTTTYNTYTAATDTAIAGKQDTLVSGTNIKTINNESILGSGNITIEGGGGKAISAGTNISVTTGETADTVSCTLPITLTKQKTTIYGDNDNLTIFNLNRTNEINHTGTTDNIIIGYNNKIGSAFDPSRNNFIFGNYNNLNQGFGGANPSFNFFVGDYNNIGKNYSENVAHTALFGTYLTPKNSYEYAFGKYNNSVSGSSTWGDSGNTLFSVGNGTADNARHNALEIRQNGDIYLNDGSKLQDTVSATAANTTALGGLSLVKLTQAQYDALATKDSNVLYVIVG